MKQAGIDYVDHDESTDPVTHEFPTTINQPRVTNFAVCWHQEMTHCAIEKDNPDHVSDLSYVECIELQECFFKVFTYCDEKFPHEPPEEK